MKAVEYAAPKNIAKAVALLVDAGDHACVLTSGTDIIVQGT